MLTRSLLLLAVAPLALGFQCGAPVLRLHPAARPAVDTPTTCTRAVSPPLMQSEIMMPALSSTMKEGKISSWLVGVGDKVEAGDMVLVVESDKADMDVESFEEGYVSQILVGEGESAPVGSPVAVLVETEAEIGNAAAPAPAAAPAAAAAAAPAAALDVEYVEVLMPALSSTMKEGKISSWLMGVGDKVSAGDMLLVVESDKADMDVEAFEDGYIAKILTGEGEVAAVLTPP